MTTIAPTPFPTGPATTGPTPGHLTLTIPGRAPHHLAPTGPVVIGRDPTCDVVIDAPGVSRHHAEIQPTSVGWVIRDLSSRNGTFANGHQLTGPARIDGPVDLLLGSPSDPSTVRLQARPAEATAPSTAYRLGPPLPARTPVAPGGPSYPAPPPKARNASPSPARVLVGIAAALTLVASVVGGALAIRDDGSSDGGSVAARARQNKPALQVITKLPKTATPAERGTAAPGAGIYNGTASNGTIAEFMTVVIQDVDRYWSSMFAKAGLPEPQVTYAWPEEGQPVAYRCSQSGQSADTTAAYCPGDDQIVFAVPFAQKLWLGQFRANNDDASARTAGDFSVAYAVAHEYAHSLQMEVGLLDDGTGKARYPVIATELHADCWAGVWANSAYYAGSLEAGDVEEGIDAAAAVGDYDYSDAAGHHGTPAQRTEAFTTGYNSGVPTACDRFLSTPAPS